MRDHLVAVDIGTASARAGIFDRSGRLIAKETHPIVLHRPDAVLAEHDSADIWNGVCASVRAALRSGGLGPERIGAIGFDATCSLVICVHGGKAGLSSQGDTCFDTICWMDHRACQEAAELAGIGGTVIERSGGIPSPEMALPKLLWLKRRRPDIWQDLTGIYDLADYMTFRCTGSAVRSMSTLASKWGYQRDGGDWMAFLRHAGLDDLREKANIPEPALSLGQAVGRLCGQAAEELGLDTGCVVAPGMIDAYAGALGLLGALPDEELTRSAALVAGTSSCLITLHRTAPIAFPSLWGPFADVSLPGYHLREGGQSAAGSLLDHIMRMHAAGGDPDANLYERINTHIEAGLREEGPSYGLPLTVLPDFHGTRAPAANPLATGTITGLSLDASFASLCRLYWRTAVGLACGLRHILDAFSEAGAKPDTLFMTGGHARNPLLVQLYADMTGLPVRVPHMQEAILLGTAVNAAKAAGIYADMRAAARAMTGTDSTILPNPLSKSQCDEDYGRHLVLLRHRAELASI